jgi:hypothetical protein
VRDRGIAPLADVPDGQRRDGGPQLVIRRKHAVVAMPVLPRRRDEVRQTIELTFRRQGHPWPLPSWAVAAKAKVWLDRRAGILPADGESSTTPLAPGSVDFRPRPRPTQLAEAAGRRNSEMVAEVPLNGTPALHTSKAGPLMMVRWRQRHRHARPARGPVAADDSSRSPAG